MTTDKMRAIRMLLATILISAYGSGHAEPLPVRNFEHLSKADGLPSNKVTAMADDPYGRIWIGTSHGLAYYDSENVKREEFFNGMAISALHDTGKEMIICTDRNTITYNYLNGRFVPIRSEGHDIMHVSVIMTIDSNKVILKTAKTVYEYDGTKTATVKRETPYTTLTEDKYGNLWGQTKDTVYSINKDFSVSRKYVLLKPGGTTAESTCLYADSKGRIWVGTLNGGLFWYNRATDKFIHDKMPALSNGKELDNICCISEDKDDRLWVGHNDGISIYDYPNGYFNTIICKNTDNSVFHTVTGLHRTAWGDMIAGTWFSGFYHIGTIDTGIRYIPFPSSGNNTGNNITANGIEKDRNGNWWIATNCAGVYKMDTEWKLKDRIHSGNSIIDDNIVAIEYSPATETFWFGSVSNGLYMMSAGKKAIKHFTKRQEGLSGNKISALKLKGGTLYIATENGIDAYSTSDKTFRNIWKSSHELSVYDITISGQKIYFLDFLSLICHDEENGHTWKVPPGKAVGVPLIQCGCTDSTGTVIMGTNRGDLYAAGDSITYVHSGYGIKENLSNMLVDRNGSIWISGGNRLYIIQEGSMPKSYDLSKYLGLNEFNVRSKYCDGSPEMIFGLTNGLMSINEKFSDNIPGPTPRLCVTGLKVNNEEARPGGAILEKPMEETTKLTLQHGENNLAFSISVIDYDMFNTCQWECSYRLSPGSDKWIGLDKARKIQCNGLRTGRYQLAIRLSDIYTGDTIAEKTIDLYIRPHVLAGMPMIAIYAIIAAALTGIFVIHFKRQKKIESDLDAARLEKEQRDSLDKMKMDIFSNIAYEFMTPVSVISSLQDSVLEPESDTYENDKNLAKKNIQRLNHLVNQMITIKSIGANGITVRKKTYDIIPFIRQIYDEFAPAMDTMMIRHSFSCSIPSLPAKFDPELMEMLVSNIMSSLMKRMDKYGDFRTDIMDCGNSVNIQIASSNPETGSGNPAQISETSGNTISSSLISSLAKLMGIAASPYVSETGTSGYKITISKEDVPNSAVPVPEKPTEITFQLINDALYSDIPSMPAEDVHQTQAEKFRILIMENDAEYKKFLESRLRKKYIVYTGTGKEAHTIISTQDIDAIICDMNLASEDPYALCRMIKGTPGTQHISILMMYFELDEDTKVKSLQAGADALIQKPVNMTELQIRLNNIFSTKNVLRKYYTATHGDPEVPGTINSSDEKFMHALSEYISSHLADQNLSVSSLAEAMHVSRTQLYISLKRLAQCTPSGYILKVKMKYASDWLSGSSMPITEIADRLGYCNANHFSRQFKNFYGASPKSWRAGHGR